jgi:predicted DNA-binding transcriptional regulator AlpA
MPEPFFTVADLAAVLRTTPAAILQARHRGSSLPRGFKIGRRILYRPEDIDAWIDSQTERGETLPEAEATPDLITDQPSDLANRAPDRGPVDMYSPCPREHVSEDRHLVDQKQGDRLETMPS